MIYNVIFHLSILSDLVGRSGTHGVAVHIDSRLLPQVEPDDGAVLGVDAATHFLQSSLEARHSGLATAVHLEPWHPPEVRTPGDGIGELLDFVKMIQHADRSLHVPHD